MVIIKFTEPNHGRVAMAILGQLELKKLKALTEKGYRLSRVPGF